jgi:transposase
MLTRKGITSAGAVRWPDQLADVEDSPTGPRSEAVVAAALHANDNLLAGRERFDRNVQPVRQSGPHLVDEIGRYDEQLTASQRRIRNAVTASNTSLTTIGGLGPITAAVIIGHTGNVDRFPTRHRFASYNATAPFEASSGPKVQKVKALG